MRIPVYTFWVLASLLVIANAPLMAQNAESLSPHGDIAMPCQNCHTSQAWRPMRADLAFDHNTETRYALTGTHAATPCRGCHLDLRLDEPKLDGDPCGLCHVDVHQGRFIETCDACHDMESFEEVNGDLVHAQTTFPLTGAHRDVACQSCHFDDQVGAYTTLDTNCFACHNVLVDEAPDHIDQNFPLECEQCHTTFSWTDGLFNHAIVAQGFALVGAHDAASCGSCHSNAAPFEPIFFPANQNDCFSCHEAQYERWHAGSGFPTTCLTCHNQNTFTDAVFNHAAVAQGFSLVGAHTTANCTSCHVPGPNFEPLFFPADQNDCFTCHEPSYERIHGGSGFPTTCLTCHNQVSFTDAQFSHATVAQGFALVGAHSAAPCTSCHVPGPEFTPIFFPANQSDCFTCHEQAYNRVHGNSGFSTNCLDCHNQNSWNPQ